MQTALVIEGFRTQWLKGVLDLFGENITIPLSTGDDIKAQSIHRRTKSEQTVHELHAIRSKMFDSDYSMTVPHLCDANAVTFMEKGQHSGRLMSCLPSPHCLKCRIEESISC